MFMCIQKCMVYNIYTVYKYERIQCMLCVVKMIMRCKRKLMAGSLRFPPLMIANTFQHYHLLSSSSSVSSSSSSLLFSFIIIIKIILLNRVVVVVYFWEAVPLEQVYGHKVYLGGKRD